MTVTGWEGWVAFAVTLAIGLAAVTVAVLFVALVVDHARRARRRRARGGVVELRRMAREREPGLGQRRAGS